MNNFKDFLDAIGHPGSINRLQAIASSNLGERSDAAYRAINKRNQRKELMDKGLSFEDACLVVNHKLCQCEHEN